MATTGTDLMRRVTDIQESDAWDLSAARNRGTLSAALVGLAIGLYWGYAKKQNLLVSGLLGGIGGALISKLLTPK